MNSCFKIVERGHVQKSLKILVCSIFVLAGLVGLPSTFAETVYSTGFEDGIINQDYSNEWMSTQVFVYKSGGHAYCIDSISHDGNKCFGAKLPDAGHNWVEWAFDFNFGEDEYVVKWEAYIKFDNYFSNNAIKWNFFDDHDLIFLMYDSGYRSESDLILTCHTNNSLSDSNEMKIGYAAKEKWVKFGYEALSNKSIRYFIGENSLYAYPYNVVTTEFPKLSRVQFHNDNKGAEYFYVDDITVYTNHVPNADPNGPYVSYKEESVVFDGLESTDLDGTISEYIWDFGDNETGEGGTVEHIYDTVGTYAVTLTVTDDDGGTNAKTTAVTVIEPCEENGKSPGFEIILVVCAIAIIIFWKRKIKP